MPKGLIIIEWDAVEGGIIGDCYPKDLQIPDNLIQILQISHNFNPGIMNTTLGKDKEKVLSIGNMEIQKVIVLLLTRYEDAEDFIEYLKEVEVFVVEFHDTPNFIDKLQEAYLKSEMVFRTRETVMEKLATEVAILKTKQADVNSVLQYLYNNERIWTTKITYLFLMEDEDNLSFKEIIEKTKLSEKRLKEYLSKMQNQKRIIKTKDGLYELNPYF